VSFRVEILSWQEAQPKAAPIRYTVFLQEKHPEGVELDELDPQSRHALALDDAGAAIGTGRLLPDGRIGRLVVLKDWRRQGVGAALIEALVGEARKLGYTAVTISAPLQAADFYRELGFAADGKVVKENGVLQQKMRKTLA
jgi:predicted GNAT family N-acyltransferase